jgi:hypothetical protein
LEVANGLLAAERGGRISPSDGQRFLGLLDALAVEIDHEGIRRAFNSMLDLARRIR